MRSVVLGAVAVLSAAAFGVGGPVAGAWSAEEDPTDDAVPGIVTEYLGEGLLDDLDHQYGPRADVAGPDFDAAVTGRLARVYFFTEDGRAGRDPRDPVIPRDEWSVPISLGGALAGSAIVAADLEVPEAHLVSWIPDPALASATDGLSPAAELVRDPQTSSWFVLGRERVRPVIPGTSGVARTRSLDRLDLDDAAPRIDPINPGTVGALAALVGLVALALAALAVTRALSRRSERQRDAFADEPRIE